MSWHSQQSSAATRPATARALSRSAKVLLSAALHTQSRICAEHPQVGVKRIKVNSYKELMWWLQSTKVFTAETAAVSVAAVVWWWLQNSVLQFWHQFNLIHNILGRPTGAFVHQCISIRYNKHLNMVSGSEIGTLDQKNSSLTEGLTDLWQPDCSVFILMIH